MKTMWNKLKEHEDLWQILCKLIEMLNYWNIFGFKLSNSSTLHKILTFCKS